MDRRYSIVAHVWPIVASIARITVVAVIAANIAILVTRYKLTPIVPQPDTPAPKPEPEKPQPQPDPWKAICKVVMQGGYCSGTIVGPRRADGRWSIVSASHCFRRVGEQVQILTRDGLTFSASVVAINRKADCAILIADYRDDLPFALVAETIPEINSQVWHGGYGFDKPGNKETGILLAGEDSNEQLRYRLNVSNGDSGGGIITDASGKLLSPVCCTTRIAALADVWGASPNVIRRMLATPTEFLGVPPVEMPIRKDGGGEQ
jgi:hypothetical protein